MWEKTELDTKLWSILTWWMPPDYFILAQILKETYPLHILKARNWIKTTYNFKGVKRPRCVH